MVEKTLRQPQDRNKGGHRASAHRQARARGRTVLPSYRPARRTQVPFRPKPLGEQIYGAPLLKDARVAPLPANSGCLRGTAKAVLFCNSPATRLDDDTIRAVTSTAPTERMVLSPSDESRMMASPVQTSIDLNKLIDRCSIRYKASIVELWPVGDRLTPPIREICTNPRTSERLRRGRETLASIQAPGEHVWRRR